MNTENTSNAAEGRELAEFIQHLRLGTPQQLGLMTVIPLLDGDGGGLEYLSLNQAMGAGKLRVREISEQGSVPELEAENLADQPVLLLDGEQLSGAKQNRVLNTSLLLKEHSRVRIPVSCVEAGRWHPKSAAFYNEDIVMAQKARAKKLRSVTGNLEKHKKYASDQGEVWDEVHHFLCFKMRVHSPTSAMSEAYERYEHDLKHFEETFRCEPQQVGFVVLFKGQVAGCDAVSRPEVYATVHAKLIKSYAIEFLFERRGEPVAVEAASGLAKEFLERVAGSPTKRFPAMAGLGESLRIPDPSLPGAALVHAGRVIHLTALNPTADGLPEDGRWRHRSL
ncbi:MAG: hypothetical protein N3J91_05865 [Verrucomicrobiae bacterium]|nr:hypothetical protein [Verrucomicrobiae bacterium]